MTPIKGNEAYEQRRRRFKACRLEGKVAEERPYYPASKRKLQKGEEASEKKDCK
jgi:hypothetical protein